MRPKTFLVGVTQPDFAGLRAYLTATDQLEFLSQFEEAYAEHGPVCLVSFYAKLCYKSLVLGKNTNVGRVRDIEDNLKSCVSQRHGSVFEHVWLNWVTTDCSRVFTHELVRHRVGTAFSQTSGRYVAIDKLDMVDPPELESEQLVPCPACYDKGAGFCAECQYTGKMPVTRACSYIDAQTARGLRALRAGLVEGTADFDKKKRLTSAIRRRAPNGQTNEVGWSCNVRSLRHMIEMRTSPAAEWEIRQVFTDVARTIWDRWPLMLEGGQWYAPDADGAQVVTGLRI